MANRFFRLPSPVTGPIMRRLGYGLCALLLSLSLWGSQGASPAAALSWVDILRGGIQVIQGVQLSNMSAKQEMELGAQINKQLVEREMQIYDDSAALTNYVDQLGQRLAQQSDRPELTYTFQVVEDDQINAYATLGGYVYVTTGLMKLAANEAELAGVIGHEIGHVEGKHLLSQMGREAWRRGLMTAAGLDRNRAVQIGVELAVRRPRSRDNEYDADLRGLRIMRAANYAESAMVSFMEKLSQQSGAPPTFLSTHPHGQDRVVALRRNLEPTRSGNDGLDANAYSQRIRPLGRR